VDVEGTDDGDRDDRGTGQHLVRRRERRQVDRGHVAVEVERLLAGPDRLRVVLARPALQLHGRSLVSGPVTTTITVAAELLGWFADQVAAPLLVVSAPAALGDWLTDRAARRPSGAAQRAGYRDPSHHRPSFGAILEELDLGADDILLEIGSGGGAFLEQALRSGCRAKAVDHSAEMLRVARELNAAAIEEGRLELLQAPAEQLPFEDDSCTC